MFNICSIIHFYLGTFYVDKCNNIRIAKCSQWCDRERLFIDEAKP